MESTNGRWTVELLACQFGNLILEEGGATFREMAKPDYKTCRERVARRSLENVSGLLWPECVS